ncbi:hypothetical protein JCGZ_20237 [Jatropha curcas]|uniref:Uncharacterized protein n=1 Tax=Jatropha curcas TaxID=180498 RepID=A0A067K6G6_JATCU|nr:hypothetical protein JCGZ_20237 [Jatropha curcas]
MDTGRGVEDSVRGGRGRGIQGQGGRGIARDTLIVTRSPLPPIPPPHTSDAVAPSTPAATTPSSLVAPPPGGKKKRKAYDIDSQSDICYIHTHGALASTATLAKPKARAEEIQDLRAQLKY